MSQSDFMVTAQVQSAQVCSSVIEASDDLESSSVSLDRYHSKRASELAEALRYAVTMEHCRTL